MGRDAEEHARGPAVQIVLLEGRRVLKRCLCLSDISEAKHTLHAIGTFGETEESVSRTTVPGWGPPAWVAVGMRTAYPTDLWFKFCGFYQRMGEMCPNSKLALNVADKVSGVSSCLVVN